MVKDEVITGVESCMAWWIAQRSTKLSADLFGSMSLNPFLTPFLVKFHSTQSTEDLASLLIASHLMIGHTTGFGKLVDEKILPKVFRTVKLDARYRDAHKTYKKACFDEIDHIVPQAGKKQSLLSLKASRWTIQLTMAVQLNHSFEEICRVYDELFDEIVVGVIYGKTADLTDKYDILRGVNRGAQHKVVDLTHRIRVLSGSEFWSWISGGEERAQEWVMEGIVAAVTGSKLLRDNASLLNGFVKSFAASQEGLNHDNTLSQWIGYLKKING